MKILFIAPIPIENSKSISGHSLASKVLYDELVKSHEILLTNMNKDDKYEGTRGFKRVNEILRLLIDVGKKRNQCDAIYLTISESLMGNLKDLCIYIICYSKLKKMHIHLHGGSIKKLLFDKYPIIRKINTYFISKFASAIILGNSHREVFEKILPDEKVHVVPNFAEEEYFIEDEKIKYKFKNDKISILFLSNLIELKGYLHLLDAFELLDNAIKEKVIINFAGGFETVKERESFLNRINQYSNITYLGIVGGKAKKQILDESQIFCLPTSFFEGQPISILESYASGLVVVTTGKGGICDIFTEPNNGFLFAEQSPISIKETILFLLEKKQDLVNIALNNAMEARKKYRVDFYTKSIKLIIEKNK